MLHFKWKIKTRVSVTANMRKKSGQAAHKQKMAEKNGRSLKHLSKYLSLPTHQKLVSFYHLTFPFLAHYSGQDTDEVIKNNIFLRK